MSGSFSQQLEELLNPQPKFIDPEDDGDEETKAKVIETFEDEDEAEGLGPSVLRKQAVSLLPNVDKRYAGRAVSRRQLSRHTDSSGEEEEEGDEEEEEEEDDEEEEEDGTHELGESDQDDFNDDADHLNDSALTFPKGVDFHKLTEGMDDLGVSEDEEGEEGSGLQSEEEEGDSGSSAGDDMELEHDSSVRTFSRDQVDKEVEKGRAVRDQLALWDQLLEGRIKLQKALVSANQLPQPLAFPEFRRDLEFTGAAKKSHKALKALQRSLHELHDHLLELSPDTQLVCQGEESGEEVVSDEGGAAEAQSDVPKPKRKLEMADYPEFMAKRFAAFQPYRNATLQKWHDKTRLTTGKSGKSFNAFERNIVTQIEQVLSDTDRLVKRTQTKRSEYRVLGKSKTAATGSPPAGAEPEAEPEARLKHNHHLKDLDQDIFDDDDFYHQLLRELIERRTSAADPNDQVAMGRQWLAIQKLRSRIKRKVDTKASKGRKVRFHVHSKLVNFMAPADHSPMSDEAKSELYRGLFGQNSAVRD